MNPATAGLDGLGVGGTFTDPTGSPKITVLSLDATQASIQVEFAGGGTGMPTCSDDSPMTGSGPGPESCAAAPSVPSGTPPMVPDGGVTTTPPGNGGGTRRDAGVASPDTRPRAGDAGGPAVVTGDGGPVKMPEVPAGPAGDGGAPAAGAVSGGCHCAAGGQQADRGGILAWLVGLGALALSVRTRRSRARG
jgi:MYXO-CTERM domain-containing protein